MDKDSYLSELPIDLIKDVCHSLPEDDLEKFLQVYPDINCANILIKKLKRKEELVWKLIEQNEDLNYSIFEIKESNLQQLEERYEKNITEERINEVMKRLNKLEEFLTEYDMPVIDDLIDDNNCYEDYPSLRIELLNRLSQLETKINEGDPYEIEDAVEKVIVLLVNNDDDNDI